jgi:hypothetical protein
MYTRGTVYLSLSSPGTVPVHLAPPDGTHHSLLTSLPFALARHWPERSSHYLICLRMFLFAIQAKLFLIKIFELRSPGPKESSASRHRHSALTLYESYAYAVYLTYSLI